MRCSIFTAYGANSMKGCTLFRSVGCFATTADNSAAETIVTAGADEDVAFLAGVCAQIDNVSNPHNKLITAYFRILPPVIICIRENSIAIPDCRGNIRNSRMKCFSRYLVTSVNRAD